MAYYIAEGAVVKGQVTMADGASVWYNATVRGDSEPIEIGRNSNIQDNAVVHVDLSHSVRIGDNVTIGHSAIVHGCTIGDNTLIGMGAIVMDDAEVGEGALVAAGSVVLSRTKIGPHEMWAGAPAKFIKMVEPEKAKEMNIKIAGNYLMYSQWFKDPGYCDIPQE